MQLAVTHSFTSARSNDAQLWAIAGALAVIVNFVILGILAVSSFGKYSPRLIPRQPDVDSVIKMILLPAVAVDSPPTTKIARRRYSRTAPNQSSSAPENPAFIGERNTRAQSDLPAVPSASALPSQAGVAPRDADDMQTTNSIFQEKQIGAKPSNSTPALPKTASPPPQSTSENLSQKTQSPTDAAPARSPQTTPIPGTRPVEVAAFTPEPTPRKTVETPQPPSAQTTTSPVPEVAPTAIPPPLPKAVDKQGHQRKTAIVGSISRTGLSTLDVADTPLGRYQAAISSAVEQEWLRNCVRHKDFITPGFLTVRFSLETTGKVRKVEFVGDMETGEVQKGFTLKSIREAPIPPMPANLRKKYNQDPMEIIFNFYF